MIKKIDARIAELEAEEKADNLAKEHEQIASEKPLVEDIKDNVSSSSLPDSKAIIPTGKIDFTNFNNKSSFNTNVKHDIMDDYLEDLSFDEEEKPSNVIKEEAIVKKDNISDNVKTNDDVYVNKDEINKIMNEKENNDDDGFFDEFFE